ncbi:MAG: DUF6350 family protein [Aeromicrobium erythreum]
MPDAETLPYVRRGAVTAVVAVGLCIGLGVVLTLLAGARGTGPVLRTGVRGWLVGSGGGLELGSTQIGLLPWGGALLVVLVAARAAAWTLTAEETELELGGFAASAAGTAGLLAAVGSALTSTDAVGTGIVRSAFGAFLLTGLGAALGAAHRTGRWDDLWFTQRADVRAVVVAAARGVLTLLSAGVLMVLVLLVPRLDRASDLWALLDPGLGGGVVLALLCLAAVPTLALWAVAVLLGPGFALGAGTSVDLTGAQLGPVPGLPVLAALPPPGRFGDAVVLLGLVPVLAGAVAGWSLRVPEPPTDAEAGPDPEGSALLRRLGLGAAAGGVAGAVVGLLVGISGGAVGPGRLADAGPPVLTPLLVAVPVLALGGAVGAVLAHYRGARASRPDARESRRPRLRRRHQPPGAAGRDDAS